MIRPVEGSRRPRYGCGRRSVPDALASSSLLANDKGAHPALCVADALQLSPCSSIGENCSGLGGSRPDRRRAGELEDLAAHPSRVVTLPRGRRSAVGARRAPEG